MDGRSLAALAVAITAAPLLESARLPVRAYTTADGLASNRINRIVRDSRGFLWFCTRAGLSRFDGYQFTNFGAAQGLPVPVYDLLETRSGEYWIATAGGIGRLNPKSSGPLFDFSVAADLNGTRTLTLAEDQAGTVWCGTHTGLCRLAPPRQARPQKERSWKPTIVDLGIPSNSEDGNIQTLHVDRSGTVWAGGQQGLYRRLSGDRFIRYTAANGLPDTHVTALLQDRSGQIWAGTWRGLCRIGGNSGNGHSVREIVRVATGPAHTGTVTALVESSTGELWVGTDTKLCKYLFSGDQETFESYTTANGLTQNQADALSEDRAGNLWIGSLGANKISRGGFITYDERDGLMSKFVASVFEDKSGELCVLNRLPDSETLSSFNGHKFDSVRPNIPRSITYWGWGENQLTFQDHAGEWWVTTGKGIFHFPPVSFRQLRSVRPKEVYCRRNGLKVEDVYRVFEDSRGDVWISTSSPSINGLTRWERATGKLHPYAERENIPSRGLARAFAEDHAGNVWIAYPAFLARYHHGEAYFEHFKLPEAPEFGRVESLYVDHAGRLWLASGAGVVRIDSPEAATPQLITYTTGDGLAGNAAFSITEDRWGRIYIANEYGVDCFYPQSPLHIKHYSASDGLVTGEFYSAFRDHHGSLWFGSPEGLSRLDPQPDHSSPAPPVFITGLRVRGVPRAVSALGETALSGIQFSPGQNQLQVEFAGLGFSVGEVLHYQYRLDGGDSQWSQPGYQRTVNYSSLAPGSYRFSVRAITTEGLVSTTPATLEFTILPAVWQSWWFRAVLVMIAASAVYAIYRFRLARLLEVERLRTRIATDLHDDIGSTLSQIAILSEVARQGSTANRLDPLSDIAHLSRESVESISDIVWAIDPEQDRLGDLTNRMRHFANDLFGNNGVSVQFRTGSGQEHVEIDAAMRRQIFLIFKELLHNCLRHSGCSVIEIEFSVNAGWLSLKIHDNGQGFEPSAIVNGHGLRSMEARAKQLGGWMRLDSVPGRGTRAEINVPLRPSFWHRRARNYTNG
ncbi:MAG: hypothetical protein JOY62_11250 [Acidobacteriaceae bacterium]|nr:hypothetical protein [Acidobacteriaceae bacterium]MBV9780535.1 hypothetical protein [Acidobacteriaceae bacterium]